MEFFKMKMDIETAKQILKENHYILESEGDLVDYACQVAEEIGFRVVDYKTEKEFNYVNDNFVYNAGYTKNGIVYIRKGSGNFFSVDTPEEVAKGLKLAYDYITSR